MDGESKISKQEFFFPYDVIRPQQAQLMQDVKNAINSRIHLLAHAPTGLGKTAAVLGPSLAWAAKEEATVFFVTPRHTQQKIVIETVRAMAKKCDTQIPVASMLGKKWMCAQENVQNFPSKDFADYCKTLREDDQCEYYVNVKKENLITPKAEDYLGQLQGMGALDAEDVVRSCAGSRLCPYEMSLLLAKKAKLIIADYYYLFHPTVSKHFLGKIGKEIENSIIIVDEGHNLGDRMRDLATSRLTSYMIKSAIQEAKKFSFAENIQHLSEMQEFLAQEASSLIGVSEKIIFKEQFIEAVSKTADYDSLVDQFETAGEIVREETGRSFLSGISSFLESWSGEDEGFVRHLNYEEHPKFGPNITLSHSCLDPSILTLPVIKKSRSTILISGTLTPTSMYCDLLGFPENNRERTYTSPFDRKNRLTLVVPNTTTQYKKRSPGQFRSIAQICANITNSVPGNVAIFFPSYAIRNKTCDFFSEMTDRPLVLEHPGSKEQRTRALNEFASHKKEGGVLLGVASGSFGEGIDLPGDLLKGVIIVGLPLNKPNLLTQALIRYYDQKYGNGWDYGYILPAITKVLQNAGRCIRTEKDRGVIACVDERYAWPQYLRCLPEDWQPEITSDYVSRIKSFFGRIC